MKTIIAHRRSDDEKTRILKRGVMGSLALLTVQRRSAGHREDAWRPEGPLLVPGPSVAFDHTAVKDPSLVFFEGRWHLFYTARGNNEYTTGYVSAEKLEVSFAKTLFS